MIRFIFCSLSVFGFLNGFSQKNFAIDGTIKGRDTGSIVLFYPNANGTFTFDTSQIQNGQFRFSGEINEPVFCNVSTKGEENFTSLFIEPKQQQLFLNENHFSEKKLIGSFTQSQDDSLQNKIKQIQSKYSGWLTEWQTLNNESTNSDDSLIKKAIDIKLDALAKKAYPMDGEILDNTISFISSHSNSYVSPTYLYGILVSHRIPSESVKKLYNNFSDDIKNTFASNLIVKELEKREINSAVPDFAVVDINNKQVSLSQFKGKYVLINFWASWCIPCVEKIPALKQYYNSYNKEGFEIINISIDQKKQAWMDGVKKFKLESFYNVLANEELKSKFPNVTQPIPSEILVSPDGKVLWNSTNKSDVDLTELLEQYFAKKE
ncbi:MAG: TlpA disulfide reductase family protein [Ginsengibacter sp.]